MFESIKGRIADLSPAHAVIETAGIGYYINITLAGYTQLQNSEEGMLYLHLTIREDAHTLYGFTNKREREIFRLLISVSGVGPNTARMMLSSMQAGEVVKAISEENVNSLKNIKGIGAKTAQRIIIDLKDKIGTTTKDENFITTLDNTLRIQALSALEVLGFARSQANKVIDKLVVANPEASVEEIIKQALKVL